MAGPIGLRLEITTDNIIEGKRVRKTVERYKAEPAKMWSRKPRVTQEPPDPEDPQCVAQLAQEENTIKTYANSAYMAAPLDAALSCQYPSKYIFQELDKPVREPGPGQSLKNLTKYEQEMWSKADHLEMQGLLNENAIEEVTRQSFTGKSIGVMFVRKVKPPDPEGRRRLKSRLVVLGNQMRDRIPTQDWSAPVVEQSVPKLIAQVALTRGMNLYSVDITQAFLKSKIYDDDIYIHITDPSGEKRFYRLSGALYGIPSAPGRWHEDFSDALLKFGLTQSQNTTCMFFSQTYDMFVGMHVDDVIVGAYGEPFQRLVGHLREVFGQDSVTVTKFQQDRPTRFLGINWTINYDKKEADLDQEDYIDQLLKQSNLTRSKPQATPATKEILQKHRFEENTPEYQKWVGALLWLLSTRPDISHAVKEVARHCAWNGTIHMTAVKRIIRYLQGTKKKKLIIRGTEKLNDLKLRGYSDASYAECKDTRRSTSGIVLALGTSVIFAKSRLQKLVATSSCEAELIAMYECSRDIILTRRILCDLGVPQHGPTELYTDSQSAMCILEKSTETKLSKHMDVRSKKIKEHMSSDRLKLYYEPTATLLPDICTKNLDSTKYTYHANRMLRADVTPTRLSQHLEEVC
jgi:hypothetical protein